MSELTKIAAILFKNLSDAFLSTASELKRMDAAPPLSQTESKQEFVYKTRAMPQKRWSYAPRDKVIVSLQGGEKSFKMRILKKVTDTKYLVYHQQQLKSDAIEVDIAQILGLDPDR